MNQLPILAAGRMLDTVKENQSLRDKLMFWRTMSIGLVVVVIVLLCIK